MDLVNKSWCVENTMLPVRIGNLGQSPSSCELRQAGFVKGIE